MTQKLEDMFHSFLVGKVPANWEQLCYISLKPLGSWCDDLYARVAFMQQWLQQGPPSCYWLAGFFFPQGFMTAVLQTHARKTTIAIDTLGFRTEITEHFKNSPLVPAKFAFSQESDELPTPDNGVYIYGIFLQGARWSVEGHLEDSKPGVLFDQLPVIWLDPIVQTGAKRDPYTAQEPGKYRCPLYKTSTRAGTLSTTGHSTNFVVALDIPSLESEDNWVRRSVAMLCMLDD